MSLLIHNWLLGSLEVLQNHLVIAEAFHYQVLIENLKIMNLLLIEYFLSTENFQTMAIWDVTTLLCIASSCVLLGRTSKTCQKSAPNTMIFPPNSSMLEHKSWSKISTASTFSFLAIEVSSQANKDVSRSSWANPDCLGTQQKLIPHYLKEV